jgi:hypothetical protein
VHFVLVAASYMIAELVFSLFVPLLAHYRLSQDSAILLSSFGVTSATVCVSNVMKKHHKCTAIKWSEK